MVGKIVPKKGFYSGNNIIVVIISRILDFYILYLECVITQRENSHFDTFLHIKIFILIHPFTYPYAYAIKIYYCLFTYKIK